MRIREGCLYAVICILAASCTSSTEPPDHPDSPVDSAKREPTVTSVYLARESTRTTSGDSIVDRMYATFGGTLSEMKAGGFASISLDGSVIPGSGTGEPMVSNEWPKKFLGLRFDGSDHQIEIVGTGITPSFVVEMPSPAFPASIAHPLVGDTVSRAAGFHIDWTRHPVSVARTSVTIEVQSPKLVYSSGNIPDTGGFFVTPELLANELMTVGPIDIALSFRTSSASEISLYRRYNVDIVTTQRIRIYLEP